MVFSKQQPQPQSGHDRQRRARSEVHARHLALCQCQCVHFLIPPALPQTSLLKPIPRASSCFLFSCFTCFRPSKPTAPEVTSSPFRLSQPKLLALISEVPRGWWFSTTGRVRKVDCSRNFSKTCLSPPSRSTHYILGSGRPQR